MKIQVKSKDQNIRLILPTKMLFSKFSAHIASAAIHKYAPKVSADIPPEAMEAIFRELRHIKIQYGSWDLVDVATADGERVLIRL